MAELAGSLQNLSIQPFAKRPAAPGAVGRKIPVNVNLYRLNVPHIVVHHYGVAIFPVAAGAKASERGLPIKLCRIIWDRLAVVDPTLESILEGAAYDGHKSVFSAKPFPCGTGTQTYQIQLDEDNTARPRLFNLQVTHAQTIDLSVLALSSFSSDKVPIAIQALDVLFRHDPARRPDTVIASQGRKFFNANDSLPLSNGACVLRGFFQSVRPTIGGMVVNVDTAMSPFVESGSLLKVAFAIVGRTGGGGGGSAPAGRGGRGGARGGRGGPPQRGGYGAGGGGGPSSNPFNDMELLELKRKLKGAKVRVNHRIDKKEYIITGFRAPSSEHKVTIGGTKGPKPSPAEMAKAGAEGKAAPRREKEGGKTMTLDAYFKKQYNVTAQYPRIQSVEVRGGSIFPIERLELLPGQSISPLGLSADQATAMINLTAVPPVERKAAVTAVRNTIVKYDENKRIGTWGVKVEKQMLQVNARVLPPPAVQYHAQSQKPKPFVGSGSWNLVESKFIGANKPLVRWAVVNFAPQRLVEGQLKAFLTTLVKQCQARGMIIRNPTPIIIDGNPQNTLEAIKQACRQVMGAATNSKSLPPQILFFLLPDPKMYDSVKRQAANELPVPLVSQVLLVKNIMKDRGIDQYCGNVAMKVNLKLHGHNWIVPPNDLPKVTSKTVIMGADVTHPPAPRGGSTIAPSVAALVCTTDTTSTSYAATIREQEGRTEVIKELKDMTLSLVRGWIERSNNAQPDSIVFFRDGVSEGQYGQVVYEEVKAIKDACSEVHPNLAAKLTYIVCAKRHNVRAFAVNLADMDRTGNLPAGTIIDTDITHPFVWDMYLQAHAGLKGTARPTHYIALIDENGFTNDQVQKLINSLCYTFARATRSVSLVPPAYYADIVCTKARSFVYDDDASTVSSGHEGNVNTTRIQEKLDRRMDGYDFAPMWFI